MAAERPPVSRIILSARQESRKLPPLTISESLASTAAATMQLLGTKRFGVFEPSSGKSTEISKPPVSSVSANSQQPSSIQGSTSHETAGIDLEALILGALSSAEVIDDSFVFAAEHGVDHQALVGTLKSLLADSYCSEESSPPPSGR